MSYLEGCNLSSRRSSTMEMSTHNVCSGSMNTPWILMMGGVGGGIILIILFFLLLSPKLRPLRRRPPGPTPWPIIGNLHMLGPLPHHIFAQLARRYGPIFSLRLGSIPTVIVSSPALAKQVLQTHDKTFAYRPSMLGARRLLYPGNLLFMQYGQEWRDLRKLCTLEIFTSKRLDETKHVRVEEMLAMLHSMDSQSQGGQLPVNLSTCMSSVTGNVISRLMIGRKADKSDTGSLTLREIVHEMSEVFGMVVIGDFIPFLGCLDFYVKRRMDRLHKQLDIFLENIIAERQAEQEPCAQKDAILDVFLRLEKEGEITREGLKAIILDLISAGTETTSDTVEWVFAELLRNPKALTKLIDEVDSVGKAVIEESDLARLSYLHAVIKETFRLHPVTPLLLPHVASGGGCEIGGYEMEEKTRVMVNVWAIGRSKEVWGESCEEFLPERFIKGGSRSSSFDDVDVRGQHFELLPFGAGRRICVGMPLAMRSIEMMVANIVHSFQLNLPQGKHPSDLDMSERVAFNSSLAHPLIVIPKLRVSHIPQPPLT